jgi:hypothetical protein
MVLRGKLLTALFHEVFGEEEEGGVQEKCLRSFIHGYCIKSVRLPQQNPRINEREIESS